jgi:hypothetical protein
MIHYIDCMQLYLLSVLKHFISGFMISPDTPRQVFTSMFADRNYFHW